MRDGRCLAQADQPFARDNDGYDDSSLGYGDSPIGFDDDEWSLRSEFPPRLVFSLCSVRKIDCQRGRAETMSPM